MINFKKKIFFLNKISIKKISYFRTLIKIEPFINTFIDSFGNFLKRTLYLTSYNYKISHIKFYNIFSEYSNIKGVCEDIYIIINNIKKVIMKVNNNFFANLIIKKRGPCIVTAKDIFSNKKIFILNPCQKIAEINSHVIFFLIMKCSHSSFKTLEDLNFNYFIFYSKTFLLLFCSLGIKNINYYIKKKFFNSNIKKLLIDIETDGTYSSEYYLKISIFYIKKYFDIFFSFFEYKKNDFVEEEYNIIEINPLFLRSIDNLSLSIRSSNCLKYNNIFSIGDLVKCSENDLLKIPKFGYKSLFEVKNMLSKKSLYLNMDIKYEI